MRRWNCENRWQFRTVLTGPENFRIAELDLGCMGPDLAEIITTQAEMLDRTRVSPIKVRMAKFRTTYQVRVIHRILQPCGRLTIAAAPTGPNQKRASSSLFNFFLQLGHTLRMIALPPRLVLGGRVAERRNSRAGEATCDFSSILRKSLLLSSYVRREEQSCGAQIERHGRIRLVACNTRSALPRSGLKSRALRWVPWPPTRIAAQTAVYRCCSRAALVVTSAWRLLGDFLSISVIGEGAVDGSVIASPGRRDW